MGLLGSGTPAASKQIGAGAEAKSDDVLDPIIVNDNNDNRSN